MRKKALITGVTGQDGSYLSEFLLNKNYLTKEEIGKHRSQINNLVKNNNNRDLTEEIQLLKIQLNEKERRIEELYNQLKFKKKSLGTFGRFGTYSFYPSHQITSGEGGMIVCNKREDYEILKSLRSHGWSRDEKTANKYPNLDPRYVFINSGFNLRPTDIQAAIGISQFKKLEKFKRLILSRQVLAFHHLDHHYCHHQTHPLEVIQ